MTVSIESDTFVRANQAGSWGTASNTVAWVKQAGSGTPGIVSNEGQLTGTASITQMTLGGSTSLDVEELVRLSTSSIAGANTSMGILFRWTAANAYYGARWLKSSGNLEVVKNNTTIVVLASVAKTVNAASFYWIRYRTSTVGTSVTFYAKMWADGSGEPAAWDIITTDSSSIFTAGDVGLFGNTAGSATISFDTYTVNQVYSLTEQTEAKFLTQFKGLLAQAEAKFLTQIKGLSTKARSMFFTQMKSLVSGARAGFRTSLSLSSAVRSKFLVRVPLSLPTRSKFINRNTFIPFKLSASIKYLLSLGFIQQPKLPLTFAVKAKLALTTTEAPLAQPNSTIQVTVNAKDINGNAVSNLSTLTCIITFPDGSISPTYSLSSGITNAGSGNYTLVYTTKGPGVDKELWTGTDAAGDTTQYENATPVSF